MNTSLQYTWETAKLLTAICDNATHRKQNVLLLQATQLHNTELLYLTIIESGDMGETIK